MSELPEMWRVQRGIETLSAIGGIYDLITLEVERMHSTQLLAYRLDNGAKSAIELLEETGRHVPTEYRQTKET